ncbi:MAG: 50S ribosomal protein L10 [Candidatus Brocadiales bacterium]
MASTINALITKELTTRYQGVHNCMVVDYQGINALEADDLRRDLCAKKMRLEVVKNSLAKLAFKGVGNGGLVELFSGPTAIVAGGDDPVVLAKTLVDWSKKVPALSIKGGLVEGRLVSTPEVEQLSKLPSREVLYAQIATLFKSPMTRFAMAVSAPLQKLRGVFDAIKVKKEKESAN